MPRKLTFIPFTAFKPDGPAHGEGLDLVQNVIPIHGGWRSLQKRTDVFREVSAKPFTGAFVHVFAQSRAVQFLRPSADEDGAYGSGTTPFWLASEGNDRFAMLDEESFIDSDYQIIRGAPSPQDGNGIYGNVALSSVTAPGSTSDHFIRWRYEITNFTAPATIAVSSITRVGSTATVTTASNHGLTVGGAQQAVTIAGANQAEYNGTFLADSVADTTHFTYTVTGTPATPATGTITVTKGWTLYVELVENITTVDPGSAPVRDVAFGSANTTGSVSREYALSVAQAGDITDYSALFLYVYPIVPGALQELRPDADDATGGWVTDAGASTNLYQAIDEATASDADYIRTGALSAGQTRTYRATLSNPTADPLRSTGHVVNYRYYAPNAGLTLVVQAKQGSTVVASKTHASIAAGSWTAGTFTLTAGEANSITDYNDLRLELAASYPTAVASTTDQYAYPIQDIELSAVWQDQAGGTTNIFQSIDEDPISTADWVELQAPVGSPPQLYYETKLGTIPDPQTDSGHKIEVHILQRYNQSQAGRADVSLYQGGAHIITESIQYDYVHGGSSTPFTETITLTTTQAALITDYSNLRIRIEVAGEVVSSYITYRVRLVTPAPRELRVSWAEMELPSAAGAKVSWAEMEVPAADTEYQGDVSTVLCGDDNDLYEASETAFTEISKLAGGYAGAGTTPGGWYFTSWGNDVIATNFVDPVQIRTANAGDFADMITSVDKPKARFVTVVGNHVVLGDINLAGHTADEVWWSAFEDETDFDPAAATLCDFQPLRSTPGQVTGLVGGENSGLVFKRRAIHLMTAVGAPAVFRFDEVVRGVGTPYPRSIVTADGYAYFWDGSSFRRTTGYGVEQVGSDVLARFLSDAQYSAEAIASFLPSSIREEDQIVVGGYDPSAGIIGWLYYSGEQTSLKVALGGGSESVKLVAPNVFSKVRAVLYNTHSDSWTALALGAGNYWTQLVQYPNTTNAETHTMKGLIGFSWGLIPNAQNKITLSQTEDRTWFKLAGPTTYKASFRTKRLTLGDDLRQAARIHGIRPIFEVKNESAQPTSLTLTLEVANDPRFLTNLRSESYTLNAANEYQFYPHQLEGYWWRFTVDVPELTAQSLTSFVGLYIEWEPGGEA